MSLDVHFICHHLKAIFTHPNLSKKIHHLKLNLSETLSNPDQLYKSVTKFSLHHLDRLNNLGSHLPGKTNIHNHYSLHKANNFNHNPLDKNDNLSLPKALRVSSSRDRQLEDNKDEP